MVVSSMYDCVEDFHKAKNETGILLQEASFFYDDESVFLTMNSRSDSDGLNINIMNLYKMYSDRIQNAHSFEVIKEQVNELTNVISKGYNADAVLIRSEIFKFILIYTINVYADPGRAMELIEARDISKEIMLVDNINDARSCILNAISTIQGIKEYNEQYSCLIKRFFDYFKTHNCGDISLVQVADDLKVNPTYLSSLIKKETGETFRDIVIKYKMEKAKKMLDDSSKKINHIASALGYQDYISFYKVFKRIQGISPNEYRDKYNI
jgi:YesN/AraC family two-component response regulator